MLEAFIDAPLRHETLTIFPVIAPHGPMLPYLLSTEIRDSSVLTVRVKGDDPAPMLLARNNSLHPILILAGEPLQGESQGRLVERSILLGGKSVTQIPASPVERGDWVAANRESEITQWLESFPIQKKQVGLLAFFGNRVLGLEALGSPNLYSPLHRRFLIRFVKKTMSRTPEETSDLPALESEAQRVVDAIGDASRVPLKRVGVGEYCSLRGPISGGDLTYRGNLVHLSVSSASAEVATESSEGRGAQCS
jgi:hypothetical protein